MATLNPQAMEFHPQASDFHPFLPYWPQDGDYYSPPAPPPPPSPAFSSFVPATPPVSDLYCYPCLGSPCPISHPVSVYNNNLLVYLGLPWTNPPPKVPFLTSYQDPPTANSGDIVRKPTGSPAPVVPGLPLGPIAEKPSATVKGQARVRAPRRRRDEKTIWTIKGKRQPDCVTEATINSGGESTTLMIRNIPNKYTRSMLLELLDNHCRGENSQLGHAEVPEEEKFRSAYDFLYLPMDFSSGCNLGYAFVNFTDHRATYRFHSAIHRKKWEVLGSKKICEIGLAKIQGAASLLKHFEKSIFACDSDDFLPVHYDPFRDGRSPFSSVTVGRRIPRAPLED